MRDLHFDIAPAVKPTRTSTGVSPREADEYIDRGSPREADEYIDAGSPREADSYIDAGFPV